MEVVRVAHISDLHFDKQKKNHCTWPELVDQLRDHIRPDLVMVTGDIADTTSRRLYREAKDALDKLCDNLCPYFVCAGNHDRHPRGNAPFASRRGGVRRWLMAPFRIWFRRAAAQFDQIFGEHIPKLDPKYVKDIPLGSAKNRWILRILGIDSSLNADASARGYVDLQVMEEIEGAMANAENVDFSILLVHHHLLPVRALERNAGGRLRDLAALTPLINCGSLLETLAASHIDVALHGHEHAPNWGRYATFQLGGGETNVIGAGSATGTVTLKPCDQKLASFNVIELREDRTVGVSVYRHDGTGWQPDPPLEIYSAAALRRSRFLRRSGAHVQRPLTSDVVRYIEFTRERDGWVRETRTQMDFSGEPQLRLRARNTTGTPTDLSIRFDGWEPPDPAFETTSHENVFHYHCDLPAEVMNRLQTLKFSFCWFGGAVLTVEELAAIEAGKRGEFRSDGYEFGALSIDSSFRELRLIVSLPSEVAPANEDQDVEAFLQDPDGALLAQVPRDVADCLRIVGRGLYALVVPYPRRGWRYGIKWKVPHAPAPSALAQQFVDQAKIRGNDYAKAFYDSLVQSAALGKCTTALYVPEEAPGALELVGRYPEHANLRSTLNTALVDNVVAQAWRGVTTAMLRRSAADYAGFEPGERALIAVPVRAGLDWANDAPWGVVRIGLREVTAELAAAQVDPGKGILLRNSLLRPMVSMLSAAGVGMG